MAHLTNFSFEFFYKIFTEDASRPLLYHGAKKSKMTKNSNQGGGSCLKPDGEVSFFYDFASRRCSPLACIPKSTNFSCFSKTSQIKKKINDLRTKNTK